MGYIALLGAFLIGVGIGQLNAFLYYRHRLRDDTKLRELDQILKKRKGETNHVKNHERAN